MAILPIRTVSARQPSQFNAAGQAATVAKFVGQRTTKDLSQEQLSNLFKDLVSGTKVLPIGCVNAVPGDIPDAYAPTLQVAETNPCHPKRCDQP